MYQWRVRTGKEHEQYNFGLDRRHAQQDDLEQQLVFSNSRTDLVNWLEDRKRCHQNWHRCAGSFPSETPSILLNAVQVHLLFRFVRSGSVSLQIGKKCPAHWPLHYHRSQVWRGGVWGPKDVLWLRTCRLRNMSTTQFFFCIVSKLPKTSTEEPF